MRPSSVIPNSIGNPRGAAGVVDSRFRENDGGRRVARKLLFRDSSPPLPSSLLPKYGRADVAYRMLLQKRLPSWLYFFEVGLTEPPEAMDVFVPNREGGAHSPGRFNVFNVFGTVTAWLYQHIGGIQPDPDQPGFKHVILRPQIGGGLSCAQTSYRSVHSSTTSGTACFMRVRTRASVSPRQSLSSLILASIS